MSVFMHLGNRVKLYTLTILIAIFLFHGNNTWAADGEAIFKNNCSSCHAVTEKVVGPALKGIEKRRDKKWLYKWIENPAKVIASGDDYANKIFAEYNKVQMTAFPNLKQDEVDAILKYIEDYKAPAAKTAVAAGGAAESSSSDSVYFLAVLLILFIVIFLLVGKINRSLLSIVNEKSPGTLPTPIPFYRNRKAIGFIIVLLAMFIGYRAADSSVDFGRSQGYAPEQPIKYSHKLHAGDMKIDCKYCHVGVEKGKQAGIPTVNICMNCHTGVKKAAGGTGAEEIAKITEAFEKNKPIKWIRIHNLPDHVFFSHAQHVKAGQIPCQTCHGQIQEMEVVAQNQPLSMSWCINCHRETKVQFKDNKYYAMYEEMHDKVKKGEIKSVTEAQLGGLDCQKCHY